MIRPKVCGVKRRSSRSAQEDAVLWGDPLVEPMSRLELPEVQEVKISSGAGIERFTDRFVTKWEAI